MIAHNREVHFLVIAGLLALGTPHRAVGYHAGHRTNIEVVQLGWCDVEIHTAEAFLAMQAAAEQDGVELWVVSGFRTNEEQADFYRAWKEGWGNQAARPGYSNHQSGRALDLGGYGAYTWLEANGKKFGFARTVPGERWHWEYVGKPKPRHRRIALRGRSR